jgi:hypothetical protein
MRSRHSPEAAPTERLLQGRDGTLTRQVTAAQSLTTAPPDANGNMPGVAAQMLKRA